MCVREGHMLVKRMKTQTNNKLRKYWTHMLKNRDYELNTADTQRTTWFWNQLHVCLLLISDLTILNVRSDSSRGKLRNSLANCVQYMCCGLVKEAIRELRKFVFEELKKSSFPCVNKPKRAFMFHCIHVSRIPLTWLQKTLLSHASGRLMSGSSWNGVQADSCGFSK
jgi:hypothetical protein